MKTRTLIFLFLAPLLAFITACDEACNYKVTSVANVDNQSSSALELKVCARGAEGHPSVQLAYGQNGKVAIESHISMKIKTGGPANACDPADRPTAVFLTSESFSMVKLCHSPESGAELVLVDLNQTCPAGYIEQLTPKDDCNSF